MAIDKYVCPTFEEEIGAESAINRLLSSYHKGKKEKTFFKGLLNKINEAPFSMALLDGIVKGSPMDPSPDNPLTKKLKWVAFNWPEEWKVLEHKGYMLLPYSGEVVAATPLISVEIHSRRYMGEDSDIIKNGDVQNIRTIRYNQGRTQPIAMNYDPDKKEKRKKERIRAGAYDPNDKLGEVLDNFEVDQLNAPQLGPAPITPSGISSGQTHEMKYQIWCYIMQNKFPEGWKDADFYELSCSFLRRAVGLPQTDKDDLDMMEGFYKNNKFEFVDVSKLK